MENKFPTYQKPGPLDIPEDLYPVVKDLVDAYNEKRVISIQERRPNTKDPEDRELKIEIRLLIRKP